MGWQITGEYVESCTCDVSCPCVHLRPATNDRCRVFLGWHITRGAREGVDFAGLNVAMAVDSPRVMTEGGWTVSLYLDARADERQRRSLEEIFSGQAGGHLANIAPLIGKVAGVQSAAIDFTSDGLHRRVAVGDMLVIDSEDVVGMDGARATVISNPQLAAVTQPLRQAVSQRLYFDDGWSIDTKGSNAFTTEFRYEG